MTAPAPPAMSEEIVGKIVDEVFGGAIEDAQVIRDIIAAYDRLRAAPPGVVVAVELTLWLLGEGDDFECPPEQFFRGKPAPYFWRKRLREAVSDQLAALNKDPAP